MAMQDSAPGVAVSWQTSGDDSYGFHVVDTQRNLWTSNLAVIWFYNLVQGPCSLAG